MNYAEVVRCFEQAGHRVETIESEHGCLACLAAAARVIAFAPDPEAESFLFNPEAIRDQAALKASLYCEDGAPGGDRLWIAPENPYFCKIDLADYVDHSSYFVPTAIDPGDYQMRGAGDSVVFRGAINVLNNRDDKHALMWVDRSIRQIASPFSAPGIKTASYQITQSLNVQSGLAGLWNIAQIPVNSIIVLPLKAVRAPRDYFNPADVRLTENACAFVVKGDAQSKIGYGCDIATGSSAAFLRNAGSLSVIFRQFAVVEDGYYCDLPALDAPNDQVLQAWDGMGFGELEYHSTAAGEGVGTNRAQDQSLMHGLTGDETSVIRIASDILRLSAVELRILLGVN